MATTYKRGECWYLNWYEGGRQRRKSLGTVTADEAETCRLAKAYEQQSGQRVFVAADLFDDFVLEYLEWHRVKFPDSHQRVKQICEQCFADFRGKALSQIEKQHVEKWLATRETRVGRDRSKRETVVASETAAKELRTLKAVFNRAVEWGRGIAASPAKGVKPPKNKRSKPPHFYSRGELTELYGESVEFAPMWRLMANTGMRRAEAQQLKWRDVKRAHVDVLSTDDERTKSGKWRQIPLSDAARQSLELLRTITGDGEYVLPRMTGPSLSRHFLRDARRLGLKGSLHSLRHSYGAHQVMSGTHLRTLQKLMGHASFATTEKYAHVAKDHALEQAKRVNI